MKKNIEYQTWVNAPLTISPYPFNKAHRRPKTFIAAFPHALPPVLSAQRLLPPISISSQEIPVLICQNSEQTQLLSCNVVFYIHPYSLIINIKQLYSFWRITQFVDTNYSVLSLELLNSSLRITQFFLSNYSILLCKDTKNRWVPHCSWYFFSILNSSYMNGNYSAIAPLWVFVYNPDTTSRW